MPRNCLKYLSAGEVPGGTGPWVTVVTQCCQVAVVVRVKSPASERTHAMGVAKKKKKKKNTQVWKDKGSGREYT